MKSEIISTTARILNADGFQIFSGVEIAIHLDQDGDKYLRINGTLHLLSDVIRLNDRLELLTSNSTVLL